MSKYIARCLVWRKAAGKEHKFLVLDRSRIWVEPHIIYRLLKTVARVSL